MPLVINTNVAALNSQRQLVSSGNDMMEAMERLSSGRRVNTAADDAAGLAIANRMTAQIRGLNQAVRNANDGVSLIQTAEGALDETTNILQRMRELAIQSANGIYSDVDRSTLDAEVQQLKSELDRIAATTTFNGQPVLDGSLGTVSLQVGSQANETIDLNITAFDTTTLGGDTGGDIVGTEMSATALFDITAGTISINNQDIGSLTAYTLTQVSTSGLDGAIGQINTNVSGVEVDAFIEMTSSASGTGILRGGDVLTLTATMRDGTQQTFVVTDTGSPEELAEKIVEVSGGIIGAEINEQQRLVMSSDQVAQLTTNATAASAAATGFDAAGSTRTAQLTFSAENDNEITVAFTDAVATNGTVGLGIDERTGSGDILGFPVDANAISEGDVTINGVTIEASSAGTVAAKVIAINKASAETGVVASSATGADGNPNALLLNSIDGEEIAIVYSGTGTGNSALLGIVETNNAETVGQSVENIEIGTVAGAQASLAIIDRALETINATRSDLGAVNNRLEFTMSNLMNVVENTSASRSRIMDADFAAETSNLARAQVLQQASQAMLAQANAQPQQVLQLLNG